MVEKNATMICAHKMALDMTQAQEVDCRKAAGTARFP